MSLVVGERIDKSSGLLVGISNTLTSHPCFNVIHLVIGIASSP